MDLYLFTKITSTTLVGKIDNEWMCVMIFILINRDSS